MTKKSRAFYMNAKDKSIMGYDPETDTCAIARTHQNCRDMCGVARPGKTAKDRARSER